MKLVSVAQWMTQKTAHWPLWVENCCCTLLTVTRQMLADFYTRN